MNGRIECLKIYCVHHCAAVPHAYDDPVTPSPAEVHFAIEYSEDLYYHDFSSLLRSYSRNLPMTLTTPHNLLPYTHDEPYFFDSEFLDRLPNYVSVAHIACENKHATNFWNTLFRRKYSERMLLFSNQISDLERQ